MRINSSGNVGIGTTSPAVKLDVDGGTSDTIAVFRSSDNRGRIQIEDNDTNIFVIAEGSKASFGLASTLSSTNLNIDSSGNVGIGTTSPVSKLEVSGGSGAINGSGLAYLNNSDDAFSLVLDNAGTSSQNDRGVFEARVGGSSVFRINNSGNVGIGTSSPSGKLHIKTDASSEFIFTGSSTSGYTTTIHMDDTGLDIGHNSSGRSLNLKTNSLDRLTISGSGNVGIGTTSPGYKLDVVGDIRSTAAVRANTNLVVGGYADISGYINHRSDFRVLNKAQTNWITWAVRDTSGTESVMDLANLGSINASGYVKAGGKTTYTKGYASLDTTGNAVAGLGTSGNGASARLVFEMHGGQGEYQRIVYACYNAGGNWYPTKVIDEGTNAFDVTDSGNGTTVTFTFKARTASQAYSPYVTIEHVGAALDTSYL